MQDRIGVLIFQWVFIALFVAGIVDMAVLLGKRRRREKWIAGQPAQRVHARVIRFRETERWISGGVRVSGSGGRACDPIQLRQTLGLFELADGSAVELEMPKGKPLYLDEGLEIMLEYQGDRFLGYQRLTPRKIRKNKKKRRRF